MSTEFNRGLQVAIDIINKEADALAEDFGTVDPDTGALEFGRGQRANFRLETYNDLRELADRIGTLRAIASAIKERKNK